MVDWELRTKFDSLHLRFREGKEWKKTPRSPNIHALIESSHQDPKPQYNTGLKSPQGLRDFYQVKVESVSLWLTLESVRGSKNLMCKRWAHRVTTCPRTIKDFLNMGLWILKSGRSWENWDEMVTLTTWGACEKCKLQHLRRRLGISVPELHHKSAF